VIVVAVVARTGKTQGETLLRTSRVESGKKSAKRYEGAFEKKG
jgi:hypothetical protein